MYGSRQYKEEPGRLHPKRREEGLSTFAFFPPHLLHYLIGNIAWGFGPFSGGPSFSGRNKNSAGNQSLLALVFFQPNRHNTRHRFISIAHEHFFSIAHSLNMRAELCLKIANVHGFHEF